METRSQAPKARSQNSPDWLLPATSCSVNSLMANEAGMYKKTGVLEKCDATEPRIGTVDRDRACPWRFRSLNVETRVLYCERERGRDTSSNLNPPVMAASHELQLQGVEYVLACQHRQRSPVESLVVREGP